MSQNTDHHSNKNPPGASIAARCTSPSSNKQTKRRGKETWREYRKRRAYRLARKRPCPLPEMPWQRPANSSSPDNHKCTRPAYNRQNPINSVQHTPNEKTHRQSSRFACCCLHFIRLPVVVLRHSGGNGDPRQNRRALILLAPHLIPRISSASRDSSLSRHAKRIEIYVDAEQLKAWAKCFCLSPRIPRNSKLD